MELNNFTREGIFIFDMDEILFNISPYMYKKIRLNWAKFFPYFKDLGPLTDTEILDRPEFFITEWLIQDRFKDNVVVKRAAGNILSKLCFTKDIYDHLEPTTLARNTLLNPEFINNGAVKKCIILSKYPTSRPEMLEGKKKTIQRLFEHEKIEFVPVRIDESKADTLKKMGIDWAIFIDDDIRNIRDFAEKFDLSRREFLIPELGYNKMPPELALLIKEKGGTISYYKTVI